MAETLSSSFVVESGDPAWVALDERTPQQNLALDPSVPLEAIPRPLLEELNIWRWAGSSMSPEGSRAFLAALELNEKIPPGVLEAIHRGAAPRLTKYLLGHGARVAIQSVMMGEALGIRNLYALACAALFHDIGKLDPEIYEACRKIGKLDRGEFQLVKQHPEGGARSFSTILSILSSNGTLPGVIKGCRRVLFESVHDHHERHDGKGYHGTPRHHISLEASIITVADAADAAGPGRHYQPGVDATALREELRRSADLNYDRDLLEARRKDYSRFNPRQGEEQLHPEVVEALLARWPAEGAPYYVNKGGHLTR